MMSPENENNQIDFDADDYLSQETPCDEQAAEATSKRALEWSLWAIRLGVLSDSVTSTILDPNFAFMTYLGPGSHPDAFPNMEPFGQTAATYFLAMTALLGAAIGSAIIGRISDKIGRKPCIVSCLGVGAVGATVNYLTRHSFWGFCASNFTQGLFAATVPVAMAYVSDVKHTRKEKDAEIGILIGLFMIGTAGGGVVTILMEEQGLFAPLFVGAALNTMATVVAIFTIIEPRKIVWEKKLDSDDDEAESPKELNNVVLSNIIIGALLDNIGSAGLLPMAMAPLALGEFYTNFVTIGEEPIMSQSAFKWLSVMLALTVVPGAAASQKIFDRVGAAGGCIIGNLITGIMIIAVLYIATMSPATNSTFAGFISALYIGFPWTVLSQLSTGPMLDTVSPKEKRGFVQGLNLSVMNFGTAISPYVLGEISDNLGVSVAMWICVGVSFAAALVNVPLVFVKLLQPKPPKAPHYAQGLKWEDTNFVDRVLRGQWVPAKELELLNMERMRKGEPFLVIPYRPYKEDKHHLEEMKAQAKKDFVNIRNYLVEIMESDEFRDATERQNLLDAYHASRGTERQRAELAQGLGKWFTDYLQDVGYEVDDSPILFKQMIMQAFPPITSEKELTIHNVEEIAIRTTHLYNKYIFEDEEEQLGPAKKAFAGMYVLI